MYKRQVKDNIIIGYGNVDDTGYIDHLYTHRDYQNIGVATAICDELERRAHDIGAKRITVHASVTALPFFVHRGYHVVKAVSYTHLIVGAAGHHAGDAG